MFYGFRNSMTWGRRWSLRYLLFYISSRITLLFQLFEKAFDQQLFHGLLLGRTISLVGVTMTYINAFFTWFSALFFFQMWSNLMMFHGHPSGSSRNLLIYRQQEMIEVNSKILYIWVESNLATIRFLPFRWIFGTLFRFLFSHTIH